MSHFVVVVVVVVCVVCVKEREREREKEDLSSHYRFQDHIPNTVSNCPRSKPMFVLSSPSTVF